MSRKTEQIDDYILMLKKVVTIGSKSNMDFCQEVSCGRCRLVNHRRYGVGTQVSASSMCIRHIIADIVEGIND